MSGKRKIKERQKSKLEVEVENLKNKLKEKERLAEERLVEIKYLKAEFENYKKALEKQVANERRNANQKLVRELLPILDDFETAIKHSGDEEARKGFELIFKKLMDVLVKNGLRPIDAIGKKFDPYYHEAVMMVDCDKPDGTVIEEVQKGYMFNSNVIRHSKVKVARKKGLKKGGDVYG